MTLDAHSHITQRDGIHGGEPCFSGTRIPIAVVLSCLGSGCSAEHIISMYPVLKLADINAALRFAAEYLGDATSRLSAVKACHRCDGPDSDCMVCGALECPHAEPLHRHGDGCPACSEDAASASVDGDGLHLLWLARAPRPMR